MRWIGNRGRTTAVGIAWVIAAAGVIGVGAGCGAERGDAPGVAPPIDPYRGVTLNVAVLDDQALANVVGDRMGEWEETRGGTVSIRVEAEDGPLESVVSDADVLIFRGDRLGALIDVDGLRILPETLVEPPSPSNVPGEVPPPGADPESIAWEEVAAPYREQVTRYGGDRVALPLGGSTLVLVYRRSAFDNEAMKAEADASGVSLEAPETWEQLDALARFLHGRDWDGDGQAEAGIALPLGADDKEGVGTEILLARAAASGLHRDFYSFVFNAETMASRLATPPFVEALEALVALKEAGPEGMAMFDIEKARSAFRSGEAALLIDRAGRADQWLEEGDETALGVARLPGSTRYYNPDRQKWEPADPVNRPGYLPVGGGWLVAVSSLSDEHGAAEDLARYLVEPETAARLRADRRKPMLPVRSSLIGMGPPDSEAIPGLDRRDWSGAVSRTFLADRVVVGLRIPGAPGYMADLDRSRAAAASGEMNAEAALTTAAEAWDARTRGLGLDRQRWHYRRSLNSLTTEPEPPPR